MYKGPLIKCNSYYHFIIFMIKVLETMGLKSTYFSIAKAMYNKPTASIILNKEKLNRIILKSGMIQDCLLLPLLFNIVFEVLEETIRQAKKNKRKLTGKEELKVSLFVDDVILYIKDPKFSTKNFLRMINFSKVSRYKINLQYQKPFNVTIKHVGKKNHGKTPIH